MKPSIDANTEQPQKTKSRSSQRLATKSEASPTDLILASLAVRDRDEVLLKPFFGTEPISGSSRNAWPSTQLTGLLDDLSRFIGALKACLPGAMRVPSSFLFTPDY